MLLQHDLGAVTLSHGFSKQVMLLLQLLVNICTFRGTASRQAPLRWSHAPANDERAINSFLEPVSYTSQRMRRGCILSLKEE